MSSYCHGFLDVQTAQNQTANQRQELRQCLCKKVRPFRPISTVGWSNFALFGFSNLGTLLSIRYISPCSGGCNTAIGGQGQSGCVSPVCHRSLSKLRISVRNMLKDAATMSWLGLVKQVLPSRDSCWLAKVPMLQSRV